MKKILKHLHHELVVKGMGVTSKGAHLFYFAAVAIEAHGMYAMAAGGLFVLLIVSIILKIDGEA